MLQGYIGTNQYLYAFNIAENQESELVYELEKLCRGNKLFILLFYIICIFLYPKGCFIDICSLRNQSKENSKQKYLAYDKITNNVFCVSNNQIEYIIKNIIAVESIGKIFGAYSNLHFSTSANHHFSFMVTINCG